MKVDFHFHLEEGPYSFGWLRRTAQALEQAFPHQSMDHEPNTLRWITQMTDLLNARLKEGCFSEGWLKAYLELGQSRGIQRFGIVDHLYRFDEFRDYYEKYILLDGSHLGQLQKYWLDRVRIGSIEDYFKVTRSLQSQGYPLSIGVEADFFPGGEQELQALLAPYELDYVIGSVHFLDGWGFDNPEAKDRYEEKDLIDLYHHLFEHLKQAAASGIFDIIAHLDNLKVFNFRPDEEELLEGYDEVAAALKRANVATEINTGLAYRYPVKQMCPSPVFLSRLYAHGVPITLSSDSHFPDDIGSMLDEAMDIANRIGYQEIVYFEKRKRIHVPLGE